MPSSFKDGRTYRVGQGGEEGGGGWRHQVNKALDVAVWNTLSIPPVVMQRARPAPPLRVQPPRFLHARTWLRQVSSRRVQVVAGEGSADLKKKKKNKKKKDEEQEEEGRRRRRR
eukprot:SAG31_NODE_8338_length_1471_cov_17.047134_1_plen_113_part_10